MHRRGYGKVRLLAGIVIVAIGGCSGNKPASQPGPEAPHPYVIGLGEIMGQNQMRHAKLWFAGRAGNWPLAAYELDELKEGFDDAVTYHPHHKDVPQPLTTLVPEFVGQPIKDLEAAIRDKDVKQFTDGFDRLTMGCNGCHKAARFGFNVVTRPTSPPFSNQRFEPGP